MKLQELCPVKLPRDIELTEEIIISIDAVEQLEKISKQYLGTNPIIIADPDTWQAIQQVDTKSTTYNHHILEPHPHADDITINKLTEIGKNHSGIIAVGSGTINDICKKAAYDLNIPYICVGTALSMNGYTSAIAAIMEKGLKTTQQARPPKAVILDTRITSNAPMELTQAGLGDLLSKQVSHADYWLSDQLEGSGYSELPSQVVDYALQEAMKSASGLTNGSFEAYEDLARAIILSGVSMVVAGSSAPASGGEHLISHLWDMEATVYNKELQLHGAQVGIATCMSASLYQHILNIETPNHPELLPWNIEEERIRKDHGPLAGTVIPQAKQKYESASQRIAYLKQNWPRLKQELLSFNLPKPDDIQFKLKTINAPHRLIDIGFTKQDGLRALRIARDIRNRITVLDLAYEIGLFPEAIETVLNDANVI